LHAKLNTVLLKLHYRSKLWKCMGVSVILFWW